ncbi:hypothetical protein HZH68_013765 [Vespula germanica]|uniref:Uncharacterized protein n=1 Tax=Vespula germanica TaxID=30212 RepID=A0A834MU56_VESGE|nr:hypothetical protein HZH68_013765 [Vespula germanica]
MAVLKLIFIILSICGCWRPSSWSLSFYKCLVYNLYTIFVAFIISSQALSQMINICLNANDSSNFSDDIYIFLAILVACFKMLSLVINRNNIVNLTVTLGQEPYQTLDNMETNIRIKFDKLSRFNTRSYAFLITLSVMSFLFLSLITDFRKRQLTFRTWLPFDDNMTPVVFYLTYTHQMLAMTLGAMIHVALDTLICDFLINICCQIRILENRLTNISNERKTILKLCIRHHECIYRFADVVNETFKFTIFVQFLASTLTVCFTLIQLTKISATSLEFIKMIFFMSGMLTQVYLYCWYGHLVTLKSQEIAYEMFQTNLMELSTDIKKSLLIMMKRTTMPIVFIVMNLFPLNLDSFMSVTFLISSLSLSQMIGIAVNADDSSNVSDDIYVFLAQFVSCFKMLSLVVNRNNIVDLIVTLGQEPHQPLDDVEMNIQTKFDRLSRFNTHSYASLISLTVSNFLLLSLITNFKKRQLTFRAWLPFDDNTTPVVFYLTYTHQILAVTIAAMIHVALDTLICNLLINICCQITILENRLTNITDERKTILKLCIRHHECIYRFAATVNKTFKFAIFVQFFASTLTVCFTLYQLTKVSANTSEFIKMMFFMSSMLTQVYLYCWYGHLVTLKSQEIAYEMFQTNLMELSNDIKKSLLIMMKRTTRPIVFIVMDLFPLNLDSFVSVSIFMMITKCCNSSMFYDCLRFQILKTAYTFVRICVSFSACCVVSKLLLKNDSLCGKFNICGCWRPPSWSLSFYKRLAYNLYTIFVAFLVSSLSLSQAIGILVNEDDSSDSSDDIYIFFAELISCFKMLSLLVNRNEIVNLIGTLMQEPYEPSDDVETRIQVKFDKWSRLNTHCYVLLLSSSVASFSSLSLVTNLTKRQLTFRAWLPFDNNVTTYVFYLTYFHQILAFIIGAALHVALDCLIFGFLIHVCCQIKILENRLTKITNENKPVLKLCIRHHDCIYKFANNVIKMFEFTIFIQFFITTSTVCFTLYQLTKVSPISFECIKILLYMCCILTQVYLYCWYGSLIETKSQEISMTIFNIDWITLSDDIRKTLLFMMKRTMKPIVFVVIRILPVNLDSFVSVSIPIPIIPERRFNTLSIMSLILGA